MTVDYEKHKVSVSIKDLKGDPWAQIEEKYPGRVPGEGKGGRCSRVRCFC